MKSFCKVLRSSSSIIIVTFYARLYSVHIPLHTPVLLLTTQSVAYVFWGANRGFASSYYELVRALRIPREKHRIPLIAAEWWMTNGDCRWRVLIHHLDCIGRTGLADELMPYSEPQTGVLGVLITCGDDWLFLVIDSFLYLVDVHVGLSA